MSILLYALVAFGYLGLAVWAWRDALPRLGLPAGAPVGGAALSVDDFDDAAGRFGMTERLMLALVWALHIFLLVSDVRAEGGVRFGFAIALSATIWLAVAVFWIESLYFRLDSMRLLILPLAGLLALLPLWFPGSAALTSNVNSRGPMHSVVFDAHLIVALAAYGLLTIAALLAFLMTTLDRWLHRSEGSADAADQLWPRLERAVLGQLPPLLTMERLLFRMLWAGFVLLTLTVLTGVVFSEALFGAPIRFDHKTIFTLIAWVIFAALLTGRTLYGWRGRVALRWTLAGFLAMFLAYAGSRFVLEVVLHRV